MSSHDRTDDGCNAISRNVESTGRNAYTIPETNLMESELATSESHLSLSFTHHGQSNPTLSSGHRIINQPNQPAVPGVTDHHDGSEHSNSNPNHTHHTNDQSRTPPHESLVEHVRRLARTIAPQSQDHAKTANKSNSSNEIKAESIAFMPLLCKLMCIFGPNNVSGIKRFEHDLATTDDQTSIFAGWKEHKLRDTIRQMFAINLIQGTARTIGSSSKPQHLSLTTPWGPWARPPDQDEDLLISPIIIPTGLQAHSSKDPAPRTTQLAGHFGLHIFPSTTTTAPSTFSSSSSSSSSQSTAPQLGLKKGPYVAYGDNYAGEISIEKLDKAASHIREFRQSRLPHATTTTALSQESMDSLSHKALFAQRAHLHSTHALTAANLSALETAGLPSPVLAAFASSPPHQPSLFVAFALPRLRKALRPT